jgi:dihydroorotate dehydrogenase electron transfer subunit
MEPFLRRPFSVYRTDGEEVEIIFNIVGKGTTILRDKRQGDWLDVVGPLGAPYGLDSPDYETGILVGGGLGVAPLPIATAALQKAGKRIETFLGARSANALVENHLVNVHISTDDGSRGYHGNVVDLVRRAAAAGSYRKPKVFGCGPNAMLRALAAWANQQDVPCEVSLEGPMGCGFGICQGCPVELAGGGNKYALMCRDGPVFDARTIVL